MKDNPIISELENFARMVCKNLGNKKTKMLNRIWILLYGFLTILCFISVPKIAQEITGKPLNEIPDLLSLLFDSKILLFAVSYIIIILILHNNRKLWKFVLCLILIAISLWGIATNIPLYDESYDPPSNSREPSSYLFYYSLMRVSFLILLTLTFIFLFYFLLYFDSILRQGGNYLRLFHRRYLDYRQSFIWISTFGSLTFVLVYLSLVKQVGGIQEPFGYPRTIFLLQIIIICTMGISLVLRAFHVKLREIEGMFYD